MIKNITVVPRATLESIWDQFKPHEKKNVAVISIIDTGAEKLKFSHRRLWAFRFDDCHPSSEFKFRHIPDLKAMTREQAEKMVNVIQNLVLNRRQWHLVVHCTAGICRSGAVGLFANFLAGNDEEEFRKRNPQILPNEWVFDSLCAVINERKR